MPSTRKELGKADHRIDLDLPSANSGYADGFYI